MTALLPRLFGDAGDWLEEGFPFFGGQLIRVEDQLTDNAYVLRAELPGLDPEKDVKVTTTGGMLTVHAERQEETKGVNRSEFRYGSMHRSVRLPAGADEEHITATYDKGILEVTVPLTAAPPTGRTITVTGK
jgi:HSP20 family protein